MSKTEATRLADPRNLIGAALEAERRWPDGEPFCYLRQTSSERNPPHGWAVYVSGRPDDVPVYIAPPATQEPVGHLHSNGDFCQDRALDSLTWPVPLYTAHPDQARRIAALEAALGKIDAIRNSIIGAQKVNWSEHIYPLVAALEAAGYHGQEYEAARANVGTMMERIAALEAALGELVALKDLKERIEAADASTYSLSDASAAQALADEYDRRKAPAWQAARAALRAIEEVRRG